MGGAGLLSAADNWVVSPLLPAMAAGFGVSVATAGTVLTAYLLPYGLMQPVAGFLADRYGKSRLLRLIVGGLALGTAGCALAGSLAWLCLWRAVTGLFAAGIIAVSLAIIGDVFPPRQRQGQVGLFMGMVFLGQGLSVGMGGFFAMYSGWRTSFALFALLAVLVLVLLRGLPKTPPTGERLAFFPEVGRALATPMGRIIFPLALVTGFFLLGVYGFLGAFLHEAVGLTYVQAGLVVMSYGFSCLLAGLVAGRLGSRYGPKRLVITGGGLAAAAAGLLLVTTSWPLGLLATICLGFGYICIQSTLATLAFEVSAAAKGLPSALIGLGLFGGGSLGTAFGSWMLPRGGYQGLWLALAGGTAVCLCLVGALLRFPCPKSDTRFGASGVPANQRPHARA